MSDVLEQVPPEERPQVVVAAQLGWERAARNRTDWMMGGAVGAWGDPSPSRFDAFCTRELLVPADLGGSEGMAFRGQPAWRGQEARTYCFGHAGALDTHFLRRFRPLVTALRKACRS